MGVLIFLRIVRNRAAGEFAPVASLSPIGAGPKLHSEGEARTRTGRGPGGCRRGPARSSPRRRNPAASGGTNAHSAGAYRAKTDAATRFAAPEITFLIAFTLISDSLRVAASAASSRTPPAAPK